MSAEDHDMNDMNDGHDAHDGHDASGNNAHELDVLLARAIAGDDAALAEVRARGASDPAVLEELAMWQADELRLVRVARELDAAASRVDAPHAHPRAVRRAGLGWAAAAAIALAWFAQSSFSRNGGADNASPRASVAGVSGGFASADDAFDAYVAKARQEGVVTGDVAPPTIVRSRELGDGQGFEVIVVRQVYERRVAPQVIRFAPSGETGRMRPVVIRPRTDFVR